jgi:hypothetical protein
VVRALKANPDEMRRLQSQGDATLAQLNRAKEYTARMKERGELRTRGDSEQPVLGINGRYSFRVARQYARHGWRSHFVSENGVQRKPTETVWL